MYLHEKSCTGVCSRTINPRTALRGCVRHIKIWLAKNPHGIKHSLNLISTFSIFFHVHWKIFYIQEDNFGKLEDSRTFRQNRQTQLYFFASELTDQLYDVDWILRRLSTEVSRNMSVWGYKSLSDQEICGYHPTFLSQECERRKGDKKTGESDGSLMQSGN